MERLACDSPTPAAPAVPARRSRDPADAVLAADAREGACRSGLMTLALVAHMPLWFLEAANGFGAWLLRDLAWMPRGVGLAAFAFVMLALPLLGGVLIAGASRGAVRRAAADHPARGLAVAAGACLATAAVGLGTVILDHLFFNPSHWNLLLEFPAVPLGVGLVGALLFRDPPPLYAASLTAGLGGPLATLAWLAGALVVTAVPWLHPAFLTRMLGAPEALVAAALVGTLNLLAAPALLAAARWVGRAFPRAPRAALVAGAAVPALLVVVAPLAVHWKALAAVGVLPVAGAGLAALVGHLGVVALGARPEGPAALTAGSPSLLRLPGPTPVSAALGPPGAASPTP